MKKIFLSALALAILTPSVAVAAENTVQRFTHEGKSYSYTVEDRGDHRLITGVIEDTRKPFRLRVSESRVSGQVGNSRMNFPLSEVKPLVAEAKAQSNVAAL